MLARLQAREEVVLGPDPAEALVPGWPVHRAVHEAMAALPLKHRRVVLPERTNAVPRGFVAAVGLSALPPDGER